MSTKPFSIRDRLKSFGYAFQGIKVLFVNEHNARIHFVAAIAAIIAGFIFHISSTEWITIVIVIGLVFSAEAFNSAIEYLANYVSPEYHDLIKKAKDLAALAVLFLAVTALIVGLIIFIPKILIL